MKIQNTNITFSNEIDIPGGEKGFHIKIPSGIQTEQVLCEEYAHVAKLPLYFGHNWDALFECIRDFHWISEKDIIISHRDLPNLPIDEKRIYLEVLSDAIAFWERDGEHKLFVVFPEEYRDEIESILKDYTPISS